MIHTTIDARGMGSPFVRSFFTPQKKMEERERGFKERSACRSNRSAAVRVSFFLTVPLKRCLLRKPRAF
jgi:hypothetical protein